MPNRTSFYFGGDKGDSCMSERANLFAGVSVSLERGFGGIATHGIAVLISASTESWRRDSFLHFAGQKCLYWSVPCSMLRSPLKTIHRIVFYTLLFESLLHRNVV